jgi:putative flippase GtrA
MIFIRYLTIGGLGYAIDLGFFLSILSLHIASISPVLASVIGKILSSIFSFVAHRYITFKTHGDGKLYHQAWRYFSLVALNTQFSALVFMTCLHWIQKPITAKIISDVICVILSYWLSKTMIFKPKKPHPMA